MIRDSSATEKLRGLDDQSGGGYQQYSEGRGNETNNSGTEGQPNKPRSLIELYCGPVNYDLLISKIFYFFFFAAFGSLFPLISVYFKQLGMNATQAGILIGIRPFIEYASAPFWGSFGERFRKGKALLLGSLVCWIVFTVSLAFLTPYVTYCSSRNTTLHFNYLFRVENADAKAIQMENDLAEMNPERQSFRIETRKPGLAPVVVNALNYPNYEPSDGDLVKPPYSTKIYRKSGVEEMFLLLLLLTVIGVFFSAPAISLADSCTLAYLGDQPELYGKQRLFGSLGWGLAMFFVGIALDNSKAFATQACPRMDDREKNYVLCFAVFSVLMSCALIAATQFRIVTEDRTDKISQKIFDSQLTKVAPAVQENLRARAPEPQEMGGGPKWLSVLKTYRSPHYAAFLFVAFWFGVGIGLVFAFLFWHLQDIGGTSSLFGVASVVNHVSEIVAYFFSFKLINKVGHMRVLYIGLAANCARFLYVSWLKEPWWILPFEFIQGEFGFLKSSLPLLNSSPSFTQQISLNLTLILK